LEQLLREKTESYDDLESVKLRLDSEVESSQAMIVELREIVRQLETDLEARCRTARQQQQVVNYLLISYFSTYLRLVIIAANGRFFWVNQFCCLLSSLALCCI